MNQKVRWRNEECISNQIYMTFSVLMWVILINDEQFVLIQKKLISSYLIYQPLNAVYGHILWHLTVVFCTIDHQLGRELKSSQWQYSNCMMAPSNHQVWLWCPALMFCSHISTKWQNIAMVFGVTVHSHFCAMKIIWSCHFLSNLSVGFQTRHPSIDAELEYAKHCQTVKCIFLSFSSGSHFRAFMVAIFHIIFYAIFQSILIILLPNIQKWTKNCPKWLLWTTL